MTTPPSNTLTFERAFDATWPAVLELMMDFFDTHTMVAGDWQHASIEVLLSRRLVQAHELQPHLQRLNASLTATQNTTVKFVPTPANTHTMKLIFWRK